MKDGKTGRPIEIYGQKKQKQRLDNTLPDPPPVQQGSRRKSTSLLLILLLLLSSFIVIAIDDVVVVVVVFAGKAQKQPTPTELHNFAPASQLTASVAARTESLPSCRSTERSEQGRLTSR